jgi:hypothetical protein
MARELRAGPLALLLEDDGSLRYLRVGDAEILRRIYVAVRDPDWETLPVQVSDLRLDVGPDRFEAAFEARAARGPIDFAWNGSVRGDADGTLAYVMDGTARTSFLKNRIGVCVLHPVRACAGRPCTVTHTDGRTTPGTFPLHASPHQPFLNVRSIAHEPRPGLTAEVRFEGETFEMEDQRNWADATYKIYSTPLALPFPASIVAGTRVRHAVTLTLRGEARLPEPDVGPAVLSLADAPALPCPDVGVMFPNAAGAPAHLRVDLEGADERWLSNAADEARALGAALEIALDGSEIERLSEMIRRAGVRVARLILLGASPDAFDLARRGFPGVLVGAGSNAHFAELNRNRPPLDRVDFVAYPAHPQAHASDERTIVENLEGLAMTVQSARAHFPGRPVALGPVSFGKRWVEGLAPVWFLAAFKVAAEAGASSITLDARDPAALGPLLRFDPRNDRRIRRVDSTRPLAVVGIAHERAFWALNLTGLPQRAVAGGRALELKPYECRAAG